MLDSIRLLTHTGPCACIKISTISCGLMQLTTLDGSHFPRVVLSHVEVCGTTDGTACRWGATRFRQGR